MEWLVFWSLAAVVAYMVARGWRSIPTAESRPQPNPVEHDERVADDDDKPRRRHTGRQYRGSVAGLAHPVAWRGRRRSRARYAWRKVRPGDRLVPVREPGNPHDPRAVALHHNGFPLGYVPRSQSWISASLDEGDRLTITVDTIEPSDNDSAVPWIGLTVRIDRDG